MELNIVFSTPLIIADSIRVEFVLTKPVERVTCQLRSEENPVLMDIDCESTTAKKKKLTTSIFVYK